MYLLNRGNNVFSVIYTLLYILPQFTKHFCKLPQYLLIYLFSFLISPCTLLHFYRNILFIQFKICHMINDINSKGLNDNRSLTLRSASHPGVKQDSNPYCLNLHTNLDLLTRSITRRYVYVVHLRWCGLCVLIRCS